MVQREVYWLIVSRRKYPWTPVLKLWDNEGFVQIGGTKIDNAEGLHIAHSIHNTDMITKRDGLIHEIQKSVNYTSNQVDYIPLWNTYNVVIVNLFVDYKITSSDKGVLRLFINRYCSGNTSVVGDCRELGEWTKPLEALTFTDMTVAPAFISPAIKRIQFKLTRVDCNDTIYEWEGEPFYNKSIDLESVDDCVILSSYGQYDQRITEFTKSQNILNKEKVDITIGDIIDEQKHELKSKRKKIFL